MAGCQTHCPGRQANSSLLTLSFYYSSSPLFSAISSKGKVCVWWPYWLLSHRSVLFYLFFFQNSVRVCVLVVGVHASL